MNIFKINCGYEIRKHPQDAIVNGLVVGVTTALAALGGQLAWQLTEGSQDNHWYSGEAPQMAVTSAIRHLSFAQAWYEVGAMALICGLAVGVAVARVVWNATPRTEPFQQPNPNDPEIHHDRNAEEELDRAFIADGGSSRTPPIYIAPHIPISGLADLKNFLLCGIAGSGKSNIIRPITAQAIDRGDLVVLHCSKGDVTRSFRTGDVVLVSPTHRDGWAWNMAEDITGRADVTEFAAMVIPQSDQPFFSDTARLVFEDVVVSVIEDHPGKWDARILLERVLADTDTNAERIGKLDLSASPLITSNDPDGVSRTVESVLATMISGAMTTLKPMAFAWTGRSRNRTFSVRRMFSLTWTGPKVLIVQSNSDFRVLSENLCGGLVRRICAHVTSPGVNLGKRRVTMLLDEFNSLGRISDFATTLSVAREKKLMVAVGIQSIHQVHKLYGSEAREILDLLQIKIFGRQGSGASAKEVAESLGNREINATVPNRLPEAGDRRTYVSKNQPFPVFSQRQFEGELGNFNPGGPNEVVAGLISYAGNAYRVDWPPTRWKQQSSGYVPAKWTKITGPEPR